MNVRVCVSDLRRRFFGQLGSGVKQIKTPKSNEYFSGWNHSAKNIMTTACHKKMQEHVEYHC